MTKTNIKIDGMSIGYEIKNPIVRQYPIYDLPSLKTALDTNIQSYMEKELLYIPNKRFDYIIIFLKFICVILSLFTQFHPYTFDEMYYILFFIIGTALSIICIVHYLIYLTKSIIFLSFYKRKLINTQEITAQKNEIKLSYGLQFKSNVDLFSNIYKLTFDVVEPKYSFFGISKVLNSISEEWPIYEFFDKEGYIYPPLIKMKINQLIKKYE